MEEMTAEDRAKMQQMTRGFNNIMHKMLADMAPDVLKFDELRWRYYSVRVGKRDWRYCWSTTRNKNGKFLGWVYKPMGSGKRLHWKYTKVREFARRCIAEKRALHMSETHQKRLDKSI